MLRKRCRLLPALAFLLTGCASLPAGVGERQDPAATIELEATPFYPQERYQCGPAALATVLTASGVDTDPAELADRVYLPGRKGSLQVELVAATRGAGRLPYVLDPALSAIEAELVAGRPVVVLQNLGVSMIPRWHYAVVVGIDGPDEAVVLRSGTDRRRVTPIDLFLKTWARGDFWALTVVEPGVLPTNVDRARYFDAIAGLEEVGMATQAATAWNAALERWPGNPVARFGLANALLAAGEYASAVDTYRELLRSRPELVAARNNLAMALAARGDYEAALAEIRAAIAGNDDDGLAGELVGTLRDIEGRARRARD